MKLRHTQPAGYALIPESGRDQAFIRANGFGPDVVPGAVPVMQGGRAFGLVLDPIAVIGRSLSEPRDDVVMLSDETQPLAFSAADLRLRQQPPSRVLWFPTASGSQQPQPAPAAANRG